MIYTVTLNPAIDRTVTCSSINTVDVTRVTNTTREAAGKGINVSKVIRAMNETSTCTGFTAGSNGEFILKSLSEQNIPAFFVNIEGNTRENIKVFATETKETLELNENGPVVGLKDMEALYSYFDSVLVKDDILVLAGSAPSSLTSNIYAIWIERYKKFGVITVLDTSKDLFKKGIMAGPTIIKPNLYELEMLFDTTINNEIELIGYARKLLDYGIKHILVTMGKDGSLFVSKDDIYKVKIPTITVQGTVGAGDSFVAGYAIAYKRKYNTIQALKYASAVSIASCLQPGTASGTLADVDMYLDEIKVERINEV